MSLFKRLRWSRHNGLITLNARKEVVVAGYKQTSERYAFIWQDAFRHIPPRPADAKVLLLGLGGGGTLPAIYEACPSADIVAVEHDPIMVEIAQELGHQGTHPFPRVVVGDAYEELQKGGDTFDLIMVDLFYGGTPSVLIKDADFWRAATLRLSAGGVAVLNLAGNPDYGTYPQQAFKTFKSWRYDHNVLCAFWN